MDRKAKVTGSQGRGGSRSGRARWEGRTAVATQRAIALFFQVSIFCLPVPASSPQLSHERPRRLPRLTFRGRG